MAFGDGGGLVLQATANAKGGVTKSWLLRYQIKKRQRWMGLDSARVVGLAEARAKANEARKLLAAGIHPIAHRDAERMAARAAELHAASFKQVLDQLLASHGDQWSAAHLEQWRSSMATYAKPLFNVAVADIDVAMVLKVIEPQWRRAPVTMDRVRGRIGEVLGFAEARGFRKPGPLPTRWKHHLDKLLPCPRTLNGVVHFPAMKHDDVLQLFAKLISSNSIPELCLAFTILTAVRSNEARGARWDEIDLATGTWTIPAIRMKTRKEHRVRLSQEALQLIERLPRRGEFLFSLNGNAPIVSISLTRVLKRHAGGDVTVHGFRSSFRDWGAERTSVSRELLESRSGMPRPSTASPTIQEIRKTIDSRISTALAEQPRAVTPQAAATVIHEVRTALRQEFGTEIGKLRSEIEELKRSRLGADRSGEVVDLPALAFARCPPCLRSR